MPLKTLAVLWLLLSLYCPALSAEPVQVTVTAQYINLHSGAGKGYPIVKVALKAETLQLIMRRADWVQVEFNQQQYWMQRADLANVETLQQERFDISTDRFDAFRQRSVETSLLLGDFNGSSLLQLSLGYQLTDVIQAELALGQANGAQADNRYVDLSLNLSPMPHWRLSPYFGIGAGWLNTTPRTILVQTPDRNNTLIGAELGARYYLSRNFIARAAYRRSVIVTDRNDNEEIDTWKLGFSVFF